MIPSPINPSTHRIAHPRPRLLYIRPPTDRTCLHTTPTHHNMSFHEDLVGTSSLSPTTGTLQLILGPMFSGKSTRLLHETNSYRAIGKRVLFINHCLNERYPGEGITTHDTPVTAPTPTATPTSTATATPIPATPTPAPPFDHTLVLEDVRELCNRHEHLQIVDSVDVICIEEIQFFNHTVDTIRYLVDTLEKHVLCAGLIADYRRQSFGDVLELIPLADEIVHLKALCTVCNDGTAGIFTQRLPSASTSEQVLVGERDTYRSVCRRHYTDNFGATATATATATTGAASPWRCGTTSDRERGTETDSEWYGCSGGVVPWYVDE